MRRDQALFLAVGVALGVLIGLLFGVAWLRPEALGLATGAPPSPVAAPAGGPRADGGMEAVAARLAALRARLERDPADAEAVAERGELLLQASMRERAVEAFLRAATLGLNDSRLSLRAATGLLRAGRPREALEAARRALELDRAAAAPAELAVVAALRGIGDLDAAAAALRELERRAPDAPALASLAAELQRARELVTAADANPRDYDHQVAAGNFFFDAGRWADAERTYRRALAVKGGNPDVLTDLGVALFRQGRREEALEQFERALSLAPQHWQAAFNGVVVALDAGEFVRAQAWLARLRAVDPQHPSIPEFEQELAPREP